MCGKLRFTSHYKQFYLILLGEECDVEYVLYCCAEALRVDDKVVISDRLLITLLVSTDQLREDFLHPGLGGNVGPLSLSQLRGAGSHQITIKNLH